MITNQELSLQVINGFKDYVIIKGDCLQVLDELPEASIDCVITSPPYWQMRLYDVEPDFQSSLLGQEEDPTEYVSKILEVFAKMKRVLKPKGSVWLNMGDKYYNKNLMGMPWRVALGMQEQGWILRNDIIWNQMKGTQSAKDRLRHVHEHLFHFVKEKRYYYDRDSILLKPKGNVTRNNGRVTSATGVSGVKYRQQILESVHLSEIEKKDALEALDNVIESMSSGEVVDFRMTIRGNQRALHSDKTKVSGRAKELMDRGFYILKSYSKGYVPPSVWNIVPEDQWRKDAHYAVFPIELLKVPIKATCPKKGIILDPFMGTGSTLAAALQFMRRAIGIEIGQKYIVIAEERMADSREVQTTLLE